MVRTWLKISLLAAQCGAISTPLFAGEAEVVDARARCAESVCTITATLRHADTGWDHYANHWRVLTPDDTEIARRVLFHPHENEQPFTRNLDQVRISPEIDYVFIEAHDSVHGYGGKRFRLQLP